MRQNYARIEDADICFCVIWLPLSESHFYRGDWALGRAPYQVVRLFKARGATYILSVILDIKSRFTCGESSLY